MSAGIHAFGGYVPRLRLQRRVIAEANAWFNPALMALGRGERATAGWDEDAITMAVEAARDCLARRGRDGLAQVILASTTLPFQDRQNAGVVAEALHLAGAVGTLDVAGSQRAGTSALIAACQVAGGGGGPVLVTSAEKRRTKAASPLELTTGDAAAALLVGEGDGVAKLLGHATFSTDFVDHYRGQDERFDYVWEERWVRDEGFLKIVPEAVGAALAAAGLDAGAIDHFCFPSPVRRAGASVAKRLGLAERSVRDNLQGTCGEAGAAHPLVMLAHALEDAAPGERILVVGFGQGCDALVFEATGTLAAAKPKRGISGYLRRGRADTDYHRYLGINDLVALEHGLRSETDRQTGLTTLYRNRKMVLGTHRRKVFEMRHPPVPEVERLRQPQLPCRGHASRPAVLGDAGDGPLLYRGPPDLLGGAARLLWHGAVRGGRPGDDRLHRHRRGRGAGRRTADADGVPRQGLRHPRRGFRRYFWKATPAGDGAAAPQTEGG